MNLFCKSPKVFSIYVLLLHENDLAALFVGDLVAKLQTRGWRIVPASVAFTDPISDREPNTLSLGQGRIAALAHEQGEAPANLVSPTEDEEYLRERFPNLFAACQRYGPLVTERRRFLHPAIHEIQVQRDGVIFTLHPAVPADTSQSGGNSSE